MAAIHGAGNANGETTQVRLPTQAGPKLTARRPAWSGAFTAPIAGRVPTGRRDLALEAIRAIHTALFASIAAAVALALWDGIRGKPGRRTAIAGGAVLAESALYITNNQVCPLTPLAEELGADRGSVVDLYLPPRVARRIPIAAGTAAILALALNVRAWMAR